MVRRRTNDDSPRLVFFDLDRTVIPGSSERAFAWYLHREGILDAYDLSCWLGVALADLRSGNWEGLRSNRAYLKGHFARIIEKKAAYFVEYVLAERIFPEAEQAVEMHRQRGDTVVLLSGSLDILVTRMAWVLGATIGIGSVLEETHRRIYTGRIKGLHPYGPAKVAVAQQYAAEHGFRLDRAIAYADDSSDRYLLERVGQAIVVNPRRWMRHEARRRGWRVVRWALDE